MKIKLRFLVIIPAIAFALFAKPAKAETEPGLNAVGYSINQVNPTRSDTAYPVCGSELENNINRSFEGEPFTGCGTDFFMLHYTGFITIPENTSVRFMVAADDGGTVKIGTHEFGTWNLKGCSWSEVATVPLAGGTYPLDGWFYEWGGGTCYMLAWQLDDGYWEIVPEWAFTTSYTPQTTTSTTTVQSTTVPVTNPTTTTVQETTTTVPETTTSVENSTSTTSSVPQTTTTESTTTTTQPPVAPTPVTPPQTTQPAPVETSVPTTLPEPSTTTTSTTVEATTTTAPLPSTTTTTVQPTTTTSLPPTTTIAPESPQTTLPAVLSDVTPTQALTVALASETLQTLTASQATEIFASLPTDQLSDSQIADITEAVQDAPTEVRESFEEEVDVFKAGFDDYVPLGSTIPVGTRRTLIAVTAGITLAAAGTRIRR